MCADGVDRTGAELDDRIVRQTADKLEKEARRARIVEFALVMVMAVGILFLVGADIWGRHQDRRKTAEGQRFAVLAVQCILGQLQDHRVADRAIHNEVLDRLGNHRRVEDLPELEILDFISGHELEEACRQFKRALPEAPP
jgi:hypothetical protein